MTSPMEDGIEHEALAPLSISLVTTTADGPEPRRKYDSFDETHWQVVISMYKNDSGSPLSPTKLDTPISHRRKQRSEITGIV